MQEKAKMMIISSAICMGNVILSSMIPFYSTKVGADSQYSPEKYTGISSSSGDNVLTVVSEENENEEEIILDSSTVEFNIYCMSAESL